MLSACPISLPRQAASVMKKIREIHSTHANPIKMTSDFLSRFIDAYNPNTPYAMMNNETDTKWPPKNPWEKKNQISSESKL